MSSNGEISFTPEDVHFPLRQSIQGRGTICGKMETHTLLSIPPDAEERALQGAQEHGVEEGIVPLCESGGEK